MARGEVLVAIDVGTSGARAVAIGLEGDRYLEVRKAYPTASPAPGWAEQDPRAWRTAALAALAGMVRQLGSRRRVLAIGLTGPCPSVCLVDANGRPLGPGLIYRDNRATAEAAAIRERFGDAAIHARTGHLPAAFHIGPKLMWLKTHEPSLFTRAARALQPRDLVAHALTGEMATDGTHGAATLVFDLRRRAWAEDLQAALGLPRQLFPRLHASAEPLAGLAPAVARRVGLPAGLPIILGGLVLSAVGMALFPWSARFGIAGIIAAIIVLYTGINVQRSPFQALVADAVPSRYRSRYPKPRVRPTPKPPNRK